MSIEAVTSILSSQILSGLDIHKPEYNVELFRPYGDQGASWFLTLEMLGFSKPVAADEYYLHEEGKIHETFFVKNSVVAPGAGNDILITLAAVSVDTSNRYYPQVGDDVIFTNEVVGRIQAIDVTTPSAPILTISPKLLTDDIGAVTAGDELSIYSNSWGEGGDQPSSRVSKPEKRTNGVKMVKTTIGASGTELTNDLWVKVFEDGTGNFLGWYNKTRDVDLSYRHNLAISHALLVDKRVTNITKVIDSTSTTGSAVAAGTDGLITVMRTRAVPYPIASGALDLDDFYAIDLALTKQWSTDQIMVCSGKKRYQNIEKALKIPLDNTNVDYTKNVVIKDILSRAINAEGKAISLNFQSVMVSNRLYHLKEMPEFNNPNTLGVTGYNFMDMAVLLPLRMAKDAQSKQLVPHSGIRYKQLGNYNRRLEVWRDGAAGEGIKIGSLDVRKDYMRSHFGAEFANVNRFCLIYAPAV